MKPTVLIDLFQRSRKDSTIAVIEGAQALKHAIRFGAEIECIITYDISYLSNLLDKIAEDVAVDILKKTEEVDREAFMKLSPQPPRTRVIALAKRRIYTSDDFSTSKPIILLEDPRDLENIGAVIRVAAAADAGGVLLTGPADPWSPAVIRGAAGLQYALPVLSTSLTKVKQILPKHVSVALEPTGKLFNAHSVPKNAVLIFGTERHGVSPEVLDKADQVVRLPMKAGVSSLNLATSVAATLYQLNC